MLVRSMHPRLQSRSAAPSRPRMLPARPSLCNLRGGYLAGTRAAIEAASFPTDLAAQMTLLDDDQQNALIAVATAGIAGRHAAVLADRPSRPPPPQRRPSRPTPAHGRSRTTTRRWRQVNGHGIKRRRDRARGRRHPATACRMCRPSCAIRSGRISDRAPSPGPGRGQGRIADSAEYERRLRFYAGAGACAMPISPRSSRRRSTEAEVKNAYDERGRPSSSRRTELAPATSWSTARRRPRRCWRELDKGENFEDVAKRNPASTGRRIMAAISAISAPARWCRSSPRPPSRCSRAKSGAGQDRFRLAHHQARGQARAQPPPFDQVKDAIVARPAARARRRTGASSCAPRRKIERPDRRSKTAPGRAARRSASRSRQRAAPAGRDAAGRAASQDLQIPPAESAAERRWKPRSLAISPLAPDAFPECRPSPACASRPPKPASATRDRTDSAGRDPRPGHRRSPGCFTRRKTRSAPVDWCASQSARRHGAGAGGQFRQRQRLHRQAGAKTRRGTAAAAERLPAASRARSSWPRPG